MNSEMNPGNSNGSAADPGCHSAEWLPDAGHAPWLHELANVLTGVTITGGLLSQHLEGGALEPYARQICEGSDRGCRLVRELRGLLLESCGELDWESWSDGSRAWIPGAAGGRSRSNRFRSDRVGARRTGRFGNASIRDCIEAVYDEGRLGREAGNDGRTYGGRATQTERTNRACPSSTRRGDAGTSSAGSGH